jgi:hypothetical protein
MTVSFDNLHSLRLDALAWLAEHYDGESEPVAWEDAIRAVLGLPLDDSVLLEKSDFTEANYNRAHQAFHDIVVIARHARRGEVEEDEHVLVTVGAYEGLTQQRDLNEQQQRTHAMTAMVDALQFWCTYVPGGLQQATRDLNVATATDFNALL